VVKKLPFWNTRELMNSSVCSVWEIILLLSGGDMKAPELWTCDVPLRGLHPSFVVKTGYTVTVPWF
jgi:hypothetical protein